MSPDLPYLATLAAQGNHFALLGLPPRYDLDPADLQRRYLALARAVHPDFYARQPEQVPRALAVSAAINAARHTLSDPLRRAEHLLQLHHGPTPHQDPRTAPDFLAEVMALREQLEQAADNPSDRATLRDQLHRRHTAALATLADLANALPPLPTLADPAVLADLRQHLNSLTYLQNLLAQCAPLAPGP